MLAAATMLKKVGQDLPSRPDDGSDNALVQAAIRRVIFEVDIEMVVQRKAQRLAGFAQCTTEGKTCRIKQLFCLFILLHLSCRQAVDQPVEIHRVRYPVVQKFG